MALARFLSSLVLFVTLLQAGLPELRRAFRTPPDDAKIMMRWWWFGPAVTQAGLEREMRLMKEGGIGGFEVQPVYPLTLDDPTKGLANLRYLSPEFLDAVRFTAETAKRLGLRMDMTLGSGWPYGGPHIPLSLASSRLRVERLHVLSGAASLALPPAKEGDQFLAAFLARGQEWTRLNPDGSALHIPADAAVGAEVLVFFASHTRQMVKRAAVGAEGFVLDHYNGAALAKHLVEAGEKLAAAAGPGGIRAMFCDSLEVYGADWTPGFLDEFRRRRGYDLVPYLPKLAVDSEPQSSEVRHDFGRTLTELANERFLQPLQQWCRRHNVLLRMQSYGTPPVRLSSHAFVDLPEGEGARWNAFSTSRWASSASHGFGRPVTSAETWTWLHSPVFRATPLDVKQEADQHFLEGITQLIGHGWPYSPEAAGRPGWRFYAAGVFNDHNPWWNVMPDLAAYLARVSFMLRQGAPANDVALYAPTADAWSEFRPGRVSLSEGISRRIGPRLIPLLLESGYNFDLIDDDILVQRGRVERGRLIIGDHGYRIVVLPGVVRMPDDAKARLREFAASGGILVATRRVPDKVPASLVQEDASLGKVLAERLAPDVALSPSAPAIGFIHRSTPDFEIYFLANTGNTPVRTHAAFRVPGRPAEWWDPKSGEVRPAGQNVIDLDLEPYGSRLLVFGNADATLDLSAGWEVTFAATGRRITMDKLHSWTDDPETRYYSGVATYRKSFQVPAGFLAQGLRVKLNLGEAAPDEIPGGRSGAKTAAAVREAAVIFVNGNRAASVWSPPYEVDLTGLLSPGANELRIDVANTAINQMAGEPLPDYTALETRYGRRFAMQDMDQVKPVPSGLMGPVRLVAH